MKKILALLLLLTSFSFAQDKDAPKKTDVYKIDFAVMEVQGGKRTNIRNYSMLVEEGPRTYNTKVGNRVPVPVGKDAGIQYMDVGLSINCRISGEINGSTVMEFNFELGSLIAPEGGAPDHGVPVVRMIRQDGVALLPLGKATVISSLDDTNTTRTVVVEATATKVK